MVCIPSSSYEKEGREDNHPIGEGRFILKDYRLRGEDTSSHSGRFPPLFFKIPSHLAEVVSEFV